MLAPMLDRRRPSRYGRVRGARGARLRGAAVVALVAAALVGASSQQARGGGGFRCGNRLVTDGDRIEEVFRRCGEPTFRSFSTDFVSFETAPGVVVTKAVPVETWTYNRGPREFVRYLTFRDGRLRRIDEGAYGY